MKTVCVAGRGVGLILYIIMGALVFDYLEKWHEEERREQSIIYKKNFLGEIYLASSSPDLPRVIVILL